jgi:hypothetical protein
MTMSDLRVRVGNQRPFAMEIDHRRGWGPMVLRGLSLLLGLLVLVGWKPASSRRQAHPL